MGRAKEKAENFVGHCNNVRHVLLAAQGFTACVGCRKPLYGFPANKCPMCFVYREGCVCEEKAS